jgi:hypothetical protein
VPSANPRLAIPMVVGLSVVLAGCVSTQTKNARLVIKNERIVASENSVHVTRINPQMSVTHVGIIDGKRGRVVIVTLQNLAAHPVSDLPISVGIAGRGGRRTYLNRRAAIGYFDTHLPAFTAGETLTWVLTLGGGHIPAGRVFADVGYASVPASTRQTSLPTIAAAAGPTTTSALEVTVANRSGVPQTQLPVFAVASRGGHTVAAGRVTIANLGGGAKQSVRLHLLGTATGASVQLFASPTIFH